MTKSVEQWIRTGKDYAALLAWGDTHHDFDSDRDASTACSSFNEKRDTHLSAMFKDCASFNNRIYTDGVPKSVGVEEACIQWHCKSYPALDFRNGPYVANLDMLALIENRQGLALPLSEIRQAANGAAVAGNKFLRFSIPASDADELSAVARHAVAGFCGSTKHAVYFMVDALSYPFHTAKGSGSKKRTFDGTEVADVSQFQIIKSVATYWDMAIKGANESTVDVVLKLGETETEIDVMETCASICIKKDNADKWTNSIKIEPLKKGAAPMEFTIHELMMRKAFTFSVPKLCQYIKNVDGAGAVPVAVLKLKPDTKTGQHSKIEGYFQNSVDAQYNDVYNLKRSLDYSQVAFVANCNKDGASLHNASTMEALERRSVVLGTIDRMCFLRAIHEGCPCVYQRFAGNSVEYVVFMGNTVSITQADLEKLTIQRLDTALDALQAHTRDIIPRVQQSSNLADTIATYATYIQTMFKDLPYYSPNLFDLTDLKQIERHLVGMCFTMRQQTVEDWNKLHGIKQYNVKHLQDVLELADNLNRSLRLHKPYQEYKKGTDAKWDAAINSVFSLSIDSDMYSIISGLLAMGNGLTWHGKEDWRVMLEKRLNNLMVPAAEFMDRTAVDGAEYDMRVESFKYKTLVSASTVLDATERMSNRVRGKQQPNYTEMQQDKGEKLSEELHTTELVLNALVSIDEIIRVSKAHPDAAQQEQLLQLCKKLSTVKLPMDLKSKLGVLTDLLSALDTGLVGGARTRKATVAATKAAPLVADGVKKKTARKPNDPVGTLSKRVRQFKFSTYISKYQANVAKITQSIKNLPTAQSIVNAYQAVRLMDRSKLHYEILRIQIEHCTSYLDFIQTKGYELAPHHLGYTISSHIATYTNDLKKDLTNALEDFRTSYNRPDHFDGGTALVSTTRFQGVVRKHGDGIRSVARLQAVRQPQGQMHLWGLNQPLDHGQAIHPSSHVRAVVKPDQASHQITYQVPRHTATSGILPPILVDIQRNIDVYSRQYLLTRANNCFTLPSKRLTTSGSTSQSENVVHIAATSLLGMWDALRAKYACDAFMLSVSRSEFYHLNNSHVARYHEKLHKKLEEITDSFLGNRTTKGANKTLSELATFNEFMDESIDQYAKYFVPQGNSAPAIMQSNSASIRFFMPSSSRNISATNIKEQVRKHGSAPTQR